MADLLRSWQRPFGLYLTVPSHADPAFIDSVRAQWPQAIISTVENRGRDIAPFLAAAARAIDDGYPLICKVHTKKSPHLRRGDNWRQEMLIRLLADGSADQIAESFRQNAALGIIAPEGHVLPGTQNLRLNQRHLAALLSKLGYEGDPMPFVFSAGSMFWVRADALNAALEFEAAASRF